MSLWQMKVPVFEGCWGHPALENTEFFLVRLCVSPTVIEKVG